jgi:PAS domain S-box-containing protein
MQNEELRRSQVELAESRDRYLDLYDFSPVGYLTLSGDGVIQDANLTSASLLGVDRKHLVGRRMAGFVAPEEIARWRRLLADVQQGDQREACDMAFQRPDGASLHGHLECEWTETGRTGSSVRVVLTDVSPRMRVEAALRRSEATYAAIARNFPGGLIGLFDKDLRYVLVDGIGRTVTGEGKGSLVGRTVQQIYPAEHRERIAAAFQVALAGGTAEFELAVDGRVMAIRTGPVTDADGQVFLGIATSRDVTDRRRAEAALRESEERYRSLVDNLHAGVVVHAPDTSIVFGNAMASELLGLSADQMYGKAAMDPAWRFVRDDQSTMPLAEYPVSRVVATGKPVVNQIVGIDRPATGDRAWVLVNAFPTLGAGGILEDVVVTFFDVTARKRADEALKESETRFRLLAGSAPVGIFQTDARGQLTFANPTFEAMMGISAPRMSDPQGLEVVHPEDREKVSRTWREAVAAGKPFSAEYRIHERAGAETWVRVFATPTRDAAGAPTGHVGALVDISVARALHAQLALTSRLAAMGTLVAGVAHEINNPLAAELAEQEMALEVVREVRERLQGSAPIDREAEVRCLGTVVEGLTDAQEGGQRIARIVKELKTFGRPDLKRTRVRLIDVVDQAMHWLPATVGHAATVRVENGGAPDVMASFGQIEQVVVNLVINAAKATEAVKPGVVIVRVGPGAPGMARLEVIDQGTGIDPAILGRIFEPFFTTSDVGQGMGLGLAVSHAIVTAHGGNISVESEVGTGSKFRVELPIDAGEA